MSDFNASNSDIDNNDNDNELPATTMTTPTSPTTSSSLSVRQISNLILALACWAFTIANVTIVVGTSAVVLLSIDGENASQLTSVPLGLFFVGASSVSGIMWMYMWSRRHTTKTATTIPTATKTINERTKYQMGLIVGTVGGTLLACLAIYVSNIGLFLVANLSFGMAMGVGFGWRFTAVDLVSNHGQVDVNDNKDNNHSDNPWAARAVTLVVSGGVIAALVGPEAAQAMKDAVPGGEYMGTMLLTGIFNLGHALCLAFVVFPNQQQPDEIVSPEQAPQDLHDDDVGGNLDLEDVVLNNVIDDIQDEPSPLQNSLETNESTTETSTSKRQRLVHWQSRSFWIPMLVAALTWSIMGMVMGMVRVVMAQVGYSSRQSLTVVEVHFVGMYAPGLITGMCTASIGTWMVAGMVALAAGLVTNVVAEPNDNDNDDNNNNSLALWVVGLFLVGVGWNLCFTAATLWTTRDNVSSRDDNDSDNENDSTTTRTARTNKTSIAPSKTTVQKAATQAANDCGMFLLAGAWIVSASYIFEAGGSGLPGWRTLHGVVAGLLGAMATLCLLEYYYYSRKTVKQ